MQLVMELPDRETPGFLRRSKKALEFSARIKAKQIDPAMFDDMVEFLLPFVKEPADRDAARAALWDASQAQFETAMQALSGGGEHSTVPPESMTT